MSPRYRNTARAVALSDMFMSRLSYIVLLPSLTKLPDTQESCQFSLLFNASSRDRPMTTKVTAIQRKVLDAPVWWSPPCSPEQHRCLAGADRDDTASVTPEPPSVAEVDAQIPRRCLPQGPDGVQRRGLLRGREHALRPARRRRDETKK